MSYLCQFLRKLHLVVVHQAIIHDHCQGLPGLEDLDTGSGPGVRDYEVSLRDVLDKSGVRISLNADCQTLTWLRDGLYW